MRVIGESRSVFHVRFRPSVLMYLLLFLMLGFAVACSQGSAKSHGAKESRVVQLGPESSRTDLFLHDDYLVAETQGLTLTPGTIRKHPANPILVKDKPWEVGNLNYTCVMQDREEGLYKMWYQVIRRKPGGGGNESWCMYATSKDGLQWEKPSLGIVEYQGSKANNIVLHEHEGIRGTPSYWVEKDYADPDPERRYKMMLQSWDFRGRAAHMASSPNGVEWTSSGYGNRLGPFDSQNIFFWDDRIGTFVGYFRSHEGGLRSISRATSPDGYHWSRPTTVHTPDAADPPTWHLYTPGIFKYSKARNTYIMLQGGFDEVSHEMYGELGVSRNGIDWHRVRQPFMGSSEQGKWDAGYIMPIPADATIGDKTAIFYHASTNPLHDSGGDRGMGVALLDQGAFLGWKAESEGTLLTHRLRVRSDSSLFHLNADAEEGSIQAELLDDSGQVLKGFSRDDCETITGVGHELTVRWKGQNDLKDHLRRGTVRLKLYLNKATVYGFKCLRPRRH